MDTEPSKAGVGKLYANTCPIYSAAGLKFDNQTILKKNRYFGNLLFRNMAYIV